MPPTLADILSRSQPEQAAVILPDEGSITTYRNLALQVQHLAAALRASGLEPGQAVGIVLPNGLENLVAFLAVTRARLVAAPFNPAYKVDEFRFYLEDSGSKALIAPPGDHPARDAARERNLPIWTAREPWTAASGRWPAAARLPHCRLPAAGSTCPNPMKPPCSCTPAAPRAGPRECRSAHANLMASINNIATHYQLSPADVGLVVMPLFHVHGLIGATLSSLWAGVDAGACRRASAPRRSGPRSRLTASTGIPRCRRFIRSCCCAHETDAPRQVRLSLHPLVQRGPGPGNAGAARSPLRRPGARGLCHDRSRPSDDVQPAAAGDAQGGQRRPGCQRRRRHHGRRRQSAADRQPGRGGACAAPTSRTATKTTPKPTPRPSRTAGSARATAACSMPRVI